jgi:pSer/pThr/pTyr-binding forkhead associated (FHA) protein
MPEGRVLVLSLSLMGRPVKSYRFAKPVVTVGRDPDADIFLENPGVSREHLRLEKTPEGDYEVVDLGSANGTFLNDLPVRCKIMLQNGDCVRFGKYTMIVTYDQDRRAEPMQREPKTDAVHETVVLSRQELGQLLELQRKAEVLPPPTPPPAALKAHPGAGAEAAETVVEVPQRSSMGGFASAATGFVLGAVAGAVATWFVFR